MPEKDEGLTRREIVAGITGAAALAALPVIATSSKPRSGPAAPRVETERMPVVYLPHGGGPWPFVETGFGDPRELKALSDYLRSLSALPKSTPTAVLVISAHWEESIPAVMTSAQPPMLYDYYGFPPASYELTWPAPGDPQLALRVRQLLDRAGFKSKEDAQRGFDHGTFVPLMLTWPEANIPTIQLSLRRGLDPAEHLAMGRALAPLRDEGVFILASGMSYHDLRGGFGPNAARISDTFDAWLGELATLPVAKRNGRLTEWTKAPAARQAHPREEHLLPLMVIAGAAGDDRAEIAWNGTFGGWRLSAFHYG